MRTLLVVVLASISSVALAQPGAEPPRASGAAPDPAAQPGFVVIDPIDASSEADFSVSYVKINDKDAPLLLRAVADIRVVDPASRVGAYARVPFALARESRNGMSDTTTDIGNLEIGGIYAPRIDQPGLGLILHAGITLPVGQTGEASAVGTIASFLALQDLDNSLPRATTLKLGVSPRFRSGQVFARFDLGLDWNLDARGITGGELVHFNAGLGLDLGPAAVMLESQNVAEFSHGNSGVLDAIAVSTRLTTSNVSPYLAVALPIDHDISAFVDVAVTLGVEIRP
jgi:hypothetical protein